MAEHLSKLVLDELAAGLATDAAALAHSRDCFQCRDRLAQFVEARNQARRDAPFEQVFAKLKTSHAAVESLPSAPKWRRRTFVFAPALAAAVALLIYIALPHPKADVTRLKGGASVRVLRAPDGTAVSSARPGEKVVLAVTSADQTFALVMAVEASGDINLVWPLGSPESARVAPGPEARLTPGFQVTPGSMALHAFLSKEPLKVETMRAQLEREVAEARRAGMSPLQAKAAPLVGVGRAMATLEVKPGS
ncbi:MAG: hypothetical protein K1X64_07190 [Myxococcaceae bacterium]|nr:hypothetical protein [Myxococcaceae bacterium]